MLYNDNLYLLMHRNHPVLLLQYEPKPKVLEIFCPERLPISIEDRTNFNSRLFFKEWYAHRITNTRTRERKNNDAYYPKNLMDPLVLCNNNGANLSDHYWICSKGSNLRWEDINYHQNIFDESDEESLKNSYQKNSPDNHTNGNLRKFWTKVDGDIYLAKYNSLYYDELQLGAHNEFFCSNLLQELQIPHAEYKLEYDRDKNEFFTLSKLITDDTNELIPAYMVLAAYKKPNHVSYYEHFINICRNKFNIDVRNDVDNMIILDSLVANEDRHWFNFGLIRNSDTLEYKGLAPLFDHEYSMTAGKFKTRTFKPNPDDQLKLINPDNSMLNKLTDSLLEHIWNMSYQKYSLKPRCTHELHGIKDALFRRARHIIQFLDNRCIRSPRM